MANKLDRLKNGATLDAPVQTQTAPAATPEYVATDTAPTPPVMIVTPLPTQTEEWIAVRVSQATLTTYAEQARAKGITPLELISQRIERVVGMNDSRPLYFNDADREALERLAGVMLKSPAHAVERVGQMARVKLEGVAPDGERLECVVQLPPNAIDRLQSRKPSRDTTLADYVTQLVRNLILDYTRLN